MAGQKKELSKDLVDRIVTTRSTETILKKCDNKVPKEKWGPVLVQRQRRNQDNGIPILKKAMELKKKKNLEFMQGYPFATLHPENLGQIAADVNLKLGANSTETEFIINNVMIVEQKSFDDFVEENPKIVLLLI
jgi:hypothetical protein